MSGVGWTSHLRRRLESGFDWPDRMHLGDAAVDSAAHRRLVSIPSRPFPRKAGRTAAWTFTQGRTCYWSQDACPDAELALRSGACILRSLAAVGGRAFPMQPLHQPAKVVLAFAGACRSCRCKTYMCRRCINRDIEQGLDFKVNNIARIAFLTLTPVQQRSLERKHMRFHRGGRGIRVRIGKRVNDVPMLCPNLIQVTVGRQGYRPETL